MKEERSYTQRGDLAFWNYRHSDSCIMIIPSKQMTGSDSILKASNLQERTKKKAGDGQHSCCRDREAEKKKVAQHIPLPFRCCIVHHSCNTAVLISINSAAAVGHGFR